MANQAFAILLTELEVLNTNIKNHLTELPRLQERQQQLETLIGDGRTLAASQTQLDGSLSDTIARRLELTQRGKHLREYLAAALRQELGTSSPRLLEFGVRPRRRRRRTTPEPGETPGQNPTPPPSDS
jgi:hypothetical protein